MQELNDRIQAFAAEHSLECVDGLYAGRYEDMYITLRAEEETALRVMVCLNLPRGGRRKALEEALAEKLARYGAKPVETAFAASSCPCARNARKPDGRSAERTAQRFAGSAREGALWAAFSVCWPRRPRGR